MEIILDGGVLVFVVDKMEMEEEEDDGEVFVGVVVVVVVKMKKGLVVLGF